MNPKLLALLKPKTHRSYSSYSKKKYLPNFTAPKVCCCRRVPTLSILGI